MKHSKPYWFSWGLPLCLLMVSGAGAIRYVEDGHAIDLPWVHERSNGTGPAVDLSFVAAPFDIEGKPEGVFIAWRDNQARIHAGRLSLDDGSFNAFPTQPTSYVTNLSVGAGGPPAERRAYVAWVGQQLELMLLVFDAEGSIISPPRPVSSAVQVVPIKIVGTDTGALLAYIWDDNPYWDPRILAVDKDGTALGEQIAEDVGPPQQTLGVTLSATPDGDFSVVYVVSGQGGVARIRRYDETGPVEAMPVEILQGTGGYDPHSSLFSPIEGAPFLLLALPYRSPNGSSDLRFAHTTLRPDEVTLGPTLSELAPDFPGGVSGAAGLAGSPELAVVLWQEIERQNPCACSVPPPIRIEFLAQIVRAGSSPEAVGAPFRVYLWKEGEGDRPPLTPPTIAASRRTPGQFTVLWSDSLLRYTTLNALSLVAVDPSPPTRRQVTMSNFPNPFTPSTSIRYSLPHTGQVRLTVFDIQGREVAALVEKVQARGDHYITWDGRDRNGSRFASGIYFAHLEFDGQVQTQKVVLVN